MRAHKKACHCARELANTEMTNRGAREREREGSIDAVQADLTGSDRKRRVAKRSQQCHFDRVRCRLVHTQHLAMDPYPAQRPLMSAAEIVIIVVVRESGHRSSAEAGCGENADCERQRPFQQLRAALHFHVLYRVCLRCFV